MDTPDFIKVTQDDIKNRFSGNYETLSKKPLQPAHAEQLMINSGSYEVYLQALRVQSAALQNLVQYATYPVLDEKCREFGVIRLPEQSAGCKATAVLIAGHNDLVIPAGTRIQSQDGVATFLLEEAVPVASGVNSVIVDLVCDTPGVVGNGYIPGKISNILDPQAYLVSITNNDETYGGSDIEADDSLRDRLYDSLNAFSTAGSKAAYRYHTKTASQLIIDVEVVGNPDTGVVTVYPLVATGPTPQEILDAVNAKLSPEDMRPINDTVAVVSPSFINYTINLGLTLYSSADPVATLAQAYAKVNSLKTATSRKLGIDAVVSQIRSAALIQDSVYDVNVISPVANVVVNRTQVAFCIGVNISVTGFNSDK